MYEYVGVHPFNPVDPLGLTWPDGFYVTYGYNDGDELTKICENGGNCASPAVPLLGFTYDSYGRRTATQARKNDGTVLNIGAYGFDASLRLQTITAPDNTVTLGYNPADQINSRAHSNPAYAPPVYFQAERFEQRSLKPQITILGAQATIAGSKLKNFLRDT